MQLLKIYICMKFQWVSFFLSVELHSPQPLAAQPFHAGPERRHRKELLVDDQPGRQAREGSSPKGHQYGDAEVREEAGAGQEEGRSSAAVRGHAEPQLLGLRGPGPLPGVASSPRVPAKSGLPSPGLLERKLVRRAALAHPRRRDRHERQ